MPIDRSQSMHFIVLFHAFQRFRHIDPFQLQIHHNIYNDHKYKGQQDTLYKTKGKHPRLKCNHIDINICNNKPVQANSGSQSDNCSERCQHDIFPEHISLQSPGFAR